jgi:hypothetical protein
MLLSRKIFGIQSSNTRFSVTARNLSRILGLNGLSSANDSKQALIKSAGMEDEEALSHTVARD